MKLQHTLTFYDDNKKINAVPFPKEKDKQKQLLNHSIKVP